MTMMMMVVAKGARDASNAPLNASFLRVHVPSRFRPSCPQVVVEAAEVEAVALRRFLEEDAFFPHVFVDLDANVGPDNVLLFGWRDRLAP